MTLNQLLKARRLVLGLTLQEVGDSAGLTKSYVHDLESGTSRKPSIQSCVRLGITLGLTIDLIAAAAIKSEVSAPS